MNGGPGMSQTGAPPRDCDSKADDRGQISIRAAEPSDATALEFFFDTMLRKDYFLKRGQLRSMIQDGAHRVLIAEAARVLVGVAVLTAGTRLVNVLVHPAYRGLHIGKALLEASGANEVRVKRDMSSGDPRKFYEASGYSPAGPASEQGHIELWRKDGDGAAPGVGLGVAAPHAEDVAARGDDPAARGGLRNVG